jgi:dynein regulatory complex protein 1
MLQADEIIHSQILGWRWEPPTEDVLAKPSKKEMSETKTEEQLALEGTVQEKGPVSKKKLKVMLGMLCNEAEFLVDQSTRDQSSDTNSQVLEADSILKALSIENEKDVERLLGYFFDTTTDEDEDSDGEDQSQKDPLGALRKTCKVKDGQVVATVRKFVADRAEKQSDDGAMQVQAASMAEKAAAAQRTKRRKEERKFWQRVANVVPPKTVRVWNALSKAMEKYENVVKERSAAIEEVQSLENQNAELKKLMNQYLSADVNDELHVPPTQVIRLN